MSFGSFEGVCSQVALPLCPLVNNGVEPTCYARNITLGSAILFQAATSVVHVIALLMTLIMIYHIKSKYTAVGRKEMLIFFYEFLIFTVVEFLVVFGVIPSASPIYPYFVAIEQGLISMLFWTLFLNGLVGFQWIEDGTNLSLWSIRISSLVMFCISGFIALGTFLGIGALSGDDPIGLFIMFFVVNGILGVAYVALQIVLVLNTLDNNRWPLGDIFFGVIFFIIAQLVLFVFSSSICTSLEHYIDGMFFGAMFNLLAVMMVYKYWDSITKEDLEFSVGGQMNVWEVREPLMQADEYGLQFGGAALNKPGSGEAQFLDNPNTGSIAPHGQTMNGGSVQQGTTQMSMPMMPQPSMSMSTTQASSGMTQPFMVDPQAQHSTMQPWAQTSMSGSPGQTYGSYGPTPQHQGTYPPQGPQSPY